MPKQMTMQDAARMAGLSRATASRSTHASRLVRPTTWQRVGKIIQGQIGLICGRRSASAVISAP